MTGKSLWRRLGRRARSPADAAKIYRRLKVRDLRGAVSKVLGPPIDPAFAMRDDIALVEGVNGWPALGIVRGDLIECADAMQPIHKALCVWELSRFRERARG
jgi:hypothetical protein